MFLNLTPFLVVIVLSFLLANIDILWIKVSARTKHVLTVGIVTILAVFAGGRWYNIPFGEGIFDYSVYEHLYKNALNTGNFMHEYLNHDDIHFRGMDIGYMFINSIFSNYVFDSPNLFFMLISGVNMYLLMKSFKLNGIENILLLVVFIYLNRLFFQYNYIMMRQSLAMAIVWCAIPLAVQRRFWPFFMVCITAATIHFTAIFFLLTYWLPKIRFSNLFILLVFPLLFILGITKATDTFILSLIEMALTSFSLGIDARLLAYIVSDIGGVNLLNFVEIAPFLFFALKYRSEICETPQGTLFFNMFIFYVLFLILTMNFMIFTRFSSYYIYSYFFIISATYRYIQNRGVKMMLGYFLVLYFTIYGIRFLVANFLIHGYNFFLFQ